MDKQDSSRLALIKAGMAFACALLSTHGVEASTDTAPLSIETLIAGTRRFSNWRPLSVSPDGRRVSYVVQEPPRLKSSQDPTGATESIAAVQGKEAAKGKAKKDEEHPSSTVGIFVTEIDTGRTTRVGGVYGSTSDASWSPSGEQIAYVAAKEGGRAQLYVANRSGAPRALGATAPLGYPTMDPVPIWLDERNILIQLPAPGAAGGRERRRPVLQSSPVTGSTATIYRTLANLTASEKAQFGNATPLISDRRTWIDLVSVDVHTGARTVLAQSFPYSASTHSFALSPDGRHLAAMAYRGSIAARDTAFQHVLDIVIIDLQHPGGWKVVAHDMHASASDLLSWSPDGRYLAWFTSGRTIASSGDVYVYDSIKRGMRRVTSDRPHPHFFPDLHPWAVRSPVWLDARHIVARVYAGPPVAFRDALVPNELWTLDVESGAMQKAAALPEPGAVFSDLVTPLGSRVALRDESGVIVAARLSNLDEVLYSVDLKTHELHPLARGPFHLGKLVGATVPASSHSGAANSSATGPGAMLAYVRESAVAPPDIWVQHLGGNEPRQITHLNPRWRTDGFGPIRTLSYPGARGEPLHAGLLLPPHWTPGTRLPLIVVVYPNWRIQSSLINRFGSNLGENLQLYATRGYGVLQVDTWLHKGSAMEDIARSALRGADEAIRLGYADPERLGVMGHSFGGYGVFSVIAGTTRFKAAVSRSGPVDWTSFYLYMSESGSSPAMTMAEDFMIGPAGPEATLWTAFDRFIANSPVYSFDRVTTPTLITFGTSDSYTDYEGKRAFTALRRLGKDAVLALYGGEGHVEQEWTPANQRDFYQRVLGWFDHYLCPDRVSPVQCR